VVAKKSAKKAVEAAKKSAKPVAKKAAASVAAKSAVKPTTKQSVAKKAPAKKALAKKTSAKKTPAKKVAAKLVPVSKTTAPAPVTSLKPVAKSIAKPSAKKATPAAAKPAAKPVPAKSAPKPAIKPVPAKSVPVKAEKPAPAPALKAVPAKPATPATPPVKNPVPVSKSSAKTPTKTEAPTRPAAIRPVGKVAVAVTSKPSSSAPKTKYKVVEYKTDEATGRPILPQGYKPSADEEYMNKLQQEYFRQRLQSWRNEMVEESKQTIENLREEVRDIGDEAERATRETENSLELRARDRARKLISKIDSTLKRLEDGDYGYCVDTGEEIGLDRLEARLTAERTIDAQERWEHLQKQQGD